MKKSAKGVMLRNGKRHSELQKYEKRQTALINKQSRFTMKKKQKKDMREN